MREFVYYARVYSRLAAQHIKGMMVYRVDFAISLVGILAINIVSLLTLWLIFRSIDEVAGWRYEEIIFIYGFSLLVASPSNICFDNLWQLGARLISGDFIKYYYRPLNILFYFVSERIDIKSFSHLVVALGVIIYASQILEVDWTIGKAMVFILLFITSSLIVISIMLIASASAFWIMIPNYALLLAVKLKDFSHYPIGIYSKFFRFLFTFIVPIGYVAFYPASFILRPSEATLFVYLSPLMGVMFFALAYLIWTKGALRYAGTGT